MIVVYVLASQVIHDSSESLPTLTLAFLLLDIFLLARDFRIYHISSVSLEVLELGFESIKYSKQSMSIVLELLQVRKRSDTHIRLFLQF